MSPKALAGLARSPGQDHPDYARGLVELGTLYHLMGQYNEARQLFEQARTVHEEAAVPDRVAHSRTMQALATRNGLCSRDQAVDDRTWFASPFYNDVLRASELDEFLISFRDLPGGRRQNAITLSRPPGAAAFRRSTSRSSVFSRRNIA